MMPGRSFVDIAKSRFTRFIRAAKNSQPSLFQPPTDRNNSLFCYTNGRWLWDESSQMESRFRRFNIPSLEQAACHAVDADKCISLEKIGEGNYNKAYRLVMEDGQKAIAKIPHPNAGPRALTTASEVATMEFARTVLNLPVPKVLAWSATDENPVQAEYIIMEESKGSQLHEVWQSFPLRAKCEIVREIVDVERKLLSMSFDKLGSLYFHDSGIQGCEPAVITNGARDICDRVRSRFCIGPTVRREFWEKEPATCINIKVPSIANREIDWIKAFADSHKVPDNYFQYKGAGQHSPDAHIALLQKFLTAIPHIVPKDLDLVSSRIWHPDFHAGNIYIDDQALISCIIDWQGAWTNPVFIGANPPPLLDYGVDMLMKLPDNFKDLDEVTKDQLRYQVSQSVLIHSYETLTAEKNPLMYKMMRHPHGQTLKQLEAFAGSTWDNCLYPFRECLIRVEREWNHFGSSEPCPYHFSAEEVRDHYNEAKSFNKNQELWKSLRGVLTDEGYTSNETFGQAIEVLVSLRASCLADLEGENRNELERKTRWVLNLSSQNI